MASAPPTPGGSADTLEPRAEPAQWPFLEHAVALCQPDQLGPSSYLGLWLRNTHGRPPLEPGDPRPAADLPRDRALRRRQQRETRAYILRAWDADGGARQSHVMDCRLPLFLAGHRDVPRSLVRYAVYLPADYLDHPERPRAVLVLASGGRGNRTRWFLNPPRGEGRSQGSGGLSVRRRMDGWAQAHPDEAVPLVVALDGPSDAFVNGTTAFLTRELPEHVQRTYLPSQPRERTPYGIEGVSSGGIAAWKAVRDAPGVFHTLGLLSLYCHDNGMTLRDLGGAARRTALFRALRERHERGLFAARFSIGRLDEYYECNVGLHHALAAEGLFAEEAERAPCPRGTDPASAPRCAERWPGFYVYPGAEHTYQALALAFPTALEWSLGELARTLRVLQGAAR